VNRECRPSVAVAVAFAVNVLVLVFAFVSLLTGYSLVRWLYFAISVLFFAIADIYNDMCRRFSATVVHVMSILVALKVVFYHFEPLCGEVVVYVHA